MATEVPSHTDMSTAAASHSASAEGGRLSRSAGQQRGEVRTLRKAARSRSCSGTHAIQRASWGKAPFMQLHAAGLRQCRWPAQAEKKWLDVHAACKTSAHMVGRSGCPAAAGGAAVVSTAAAGRQARPPHGLPALHPLSARPAAAQTPGAAVAGDAAIAPQQAPAGSAQAQADHLLKGRTARQVSAGEQGQKAAPAAGERRCTTSKERRAIQAVSASHHGLHLYQAASHSPTR